MTDFEKSEVIRKQEIMFKLFDGYVDPHRAWHEALAAQLDPAIFCGDY